ncbi:hypothetical protein LG200_09980 [Methylobacillus caricis]|uniref:hypothetical protein n=1 Tax=Methylobacillus caricis TaxID=1971611 RepID=UPI001CFFFF43|nr:hypothetical protein [Methylobacillus caricis]MCB5188326.1 hypothetical protein [Methylobacillus caricis]
MFEDIRNEPDGPSRLRMRTSTVEKKLVEEILPICKYLQTKYGAGRYMSVCWKSGSQPYDAELHQAGSYIDQGYFSSIGFLEVTCAVHPKDYLNRELLSTQGFAFGTNGLSRLENRTIKSVPTLRSNQDFVEQFAQYVLKRIKDKAKKPYPANTTLIISCSLDTNPYMPDDWGLLQKLVTEASPTHNFNEIFVYSNIGEYSFSIWPAR